MLEATVWAILKFILMFSGGWYIGTKISKWERKHKLKEFALDGLQLTDAIYLNENVKMTVPLGDSILHVVLNTKLGKVFVTGDKTRAAHHQAIGWQVFAMCFTRTRDSCIVLVKDTADVNNPFNFLTGKFVTLPTNKDSYVHVLE